MLVVPIPHREFNLYALSLTEPTVPMAHGDPERPDRPGLKERRPLLAASAKNVHERFKLLTSTITHYPALMAVGELYFALPDPDDNFVSDLQTENFDSRLFEL